MANGYDDRPGADLGDVGCGTDGCLPELTRDGDVNDEESRWSCKEDLVSSGGPCEIEYSFDEKQDVSEIQVAFLKYDERSRELKVGHAQDG